jgi:hypothetical protein
MPVTTHTRASKLHISLPPDLMAFVARRREEQKGTISAAIAESIRRDMLAERQARLEEALALDAVDGLAFSRATGAVASRVLARDAE